ncbi:hypothetical protein GGI22_003341, partial [Coemansia erecta]
TQCPGSGAVREALADMEHGSRINTAVQRERHKDASDYVHHSVEIGPGLARQTAHGGNKQYGWHNFV